ncbi:hypothetical protein [Jiella avicenniae]|uniref:Uncharacterized protein n=1 Tax=Jiella avicenniae TaxID=2907202 RepID=A0A9X1P365_9HYPH|nr:hypothetical protein [Jiella avicenniae]MCE7028488.1 hypothetical protein [Jiella avicenniae]
MIFLRIKKRARQRISEWFAAFNITGFGLSLLAPGDTFASPSFQAFNEAFPERFFGMSPEEQWGIIITLTGTLWIVGLIINGARQRATMHIRATCSLIGAAVYGTLALGFFLPYAVFLSNLGILDALRTIFGFINPPNAVYLSTGVWNYFSISILCLYTIHAGLTEPQEEHDRHGRDRS